MSRAIWCTVIFDFAATQQSPVIIDRYEVSADARKVWSYFDTDRVGVLKYPASLIKYPEAIGFTKEEVIELFGPGNIGSTFDSYGIPVGIPRDNWEKIMTSSGRTLRSAEFFYKKSSFLEKESNENTNTVTGELASLDKAYFYDKQVNTLRIFLERNKDIDLRKERELFTAGYYLFLDFKPREK